MGAEHLIVLVILGILALATTGRGVKMLRGVSGDGETAIFFSTRDVVLGVALLIASIFTSVFVGNLLNEFFGDRLSEPLMVFIPAIVSQIAMIASFFVFKRFADARFSVSETRERAVRCAEFGVKSMLYFLPFIMLLSTFSTLVLGLFTGTEPARQGAVDIVAETEGVVQIMMSAFSVMLLAPISEELLFRCVIYRGVKGYCESGGGLLLPEVFSERAGYIATFVSALIFALIHFSLVAFLPIFVLGAIFAICYERTRSIWVPIAMHSVFNTVNFALVNIAALAEAEGGYGL